MPSSVFLSKAKMKKQNKKRVKHTFSAPQYFTLRGH